MGHGLAKNCSWERVERAFLGGIGGLDCNHARLVGTAGLVVTKLSAAEAFGNGIVLRFRLRCILGGVVSRRLVLGFVLGLFSEVVVVGKSLVVVERFLRLPGHDISSEQPSVWVVSPIEITDLACSLESGRVLGRDISADLWTDDSEKLFSFEPLVFVVFNFAPVCKRCIDGLPDFMTSAGVGVIQMHTAPPMSVMGSMVSVQSQQCSLDLAEIGFVFG